jgi:hypothetical protein
MELQIALTPALADFFRQFQQSSPFTNYQYVEVTFGAADTDLDLRHGLRVALPDDIDYTLMRSDRSTNIYHDQSASRKVWGSNYVILRSSAANANCRILLTSKRT